MSCIKLEKLSSVSRVLGGSWVVVSGVISPLFWVVSMITVLITPLITIHEHLRRLRDMIFSFSLRLTCRSHELEKGLKPVFNLGTAKLSDVCSKVHGVRSRSLNCAFTLVCLDRRRYDSASSHTFTTKPRHQSQCINTESSNSYTRPIPYTVQKRLCYQPEHKRRQRSKTLPESPK